MNDDAVDLLMEVRNIFAPQNGVERDVFNKIDKYLEMVRLEEKYEQEESVRPNRKKSGRLQGTIEEWSD